MQEHFVENAKLSENYFIVDCEVMLVCLSTELCLVEKQELFFFFFLFKVCQISSLRNASLIFYNVLESESCCRP